MIRCILDVELHHLRIDDLIWHFVFSNASLSFSLDYIINEEDCKYKNVFIRRPKLIGSFTWTDGRAIIPHGAIHDTSWD